MPRVGQTSPDTLQLRILDPRSGRPKRPPRIAKLLATYRNAQVLEDFHLTGPGAGRRFEAIQAMQERIRSYVNGEEGAGELPGEEELRELGSWLFECLFPGTVRDLYQRLSSTRDDSRLGIVLTSMIPWVADLPWEFAYDPVRRAYLATEEINFVRNVVTAIPAEEAGPRRRVLRILVVAAQPLGWGPVSEQEEIELVSRGFRGLAEQGLVEFEVLCRATPQGLHEALQGAQLQGQGFDVLHFIGHGEYDETLGTGCLIFEDGRGRSARLDTDSLRQVARQRGLRILFLNACETGTGYTVDFNRRGVAQGLVAGGVPVVVGNQYKVLDRSATVFARHFYWALARGATVGDAAREARVAVSYSISGEILDWAVPVVFAQNPGEVLCPWEREPAEAGQRPGTKREPSVEGPRRARWPARRRIGLWDVNGALPRLVEVVERLNEAQDFFELECVDLMAPIGTWRLERRKQARTEAYILAEQVVARLGDRPQELGLRKLLCFTTFPLADREFFNLYSWDELTYPHDHIALFSLAGFEHRFEDPELLFERAIANLVSGALVPVESHPEPPEDCPSYFNPEREARWLAGRVRFCARCECALRAWLDGGELQARQVEAARAILNAFAPPAI